MNVAENLDRINTQVKQVERQYQRPSNSVRLLAVSKKQSIALIRQAYDAGHTLFGENYVQEALEKQEALKDCDIEWHFIGSIQANKTKLITAHFDWVHSVDRFKIAKRLSEQRPEGRLPLNVCIEVNINAESTKSGVQPEKLLGLISEISVLTNLRIRGLMVIPKHYSDFEHQKAIFEKVSLLQGTLIEAGFDLDTLSMGMSQDFEAAIAAGSTVIRLGEAVFGARV